MCATSAMVPPESGIRSVRQPGKAHLPPLAAKSRLMFEDEARLFIDAFVSLLRCLRRYFKGAAPRLYRPPNGVALHRRPAKPAVRCKGLVRRYPLHILHAVYCRPTNPTNCAYFRRVVCTCAQIVEGIVFSAENAFNSMQAPAGEISRFARTSVRTLRCSEWT